MGRLKVILKNGEVRTTFLIFLLAIPLIFIFVAVPLYAGTFDGFFTITNPGEWWGRFNVAIRGAVFETVSTLTGTGYNSLPSLIPWPHIGLFIYIMLMGIGGHTNSTAGGIKQIRIYMVWKSIIWFFQGMFYPKSAVTERYILKQEDKVFMKPEHLREVLNYVVIYVFVVCIGSIILLAYGYPMQASLFEFSSALGNVGLSYGIVSPDAPAGVLITLIFGMFLGRLEFLVIILSVAKILKDIRIYFEK